MKDRQTKAHDSGYLGTDAPWRAVLRLAIPSMLAQFVNVLYSIVDRIYIGHMEGVGKEALAGVGICGPLVTLLSSFGTWVGLGGSPAMSIKMGEKDTAGAQKILSNGALLLAVMSVLLTGAAFAFRTPLLRLAGACVLVIFTPGMWAVLPGIPLQEADAIGAALLADGEDLL